MKANAVPAPLMRNGPARSAQKFPLAGACAAHRIPAPMRVMPKARTSFAEVLVTIRCERPASVNEVTDAVIQAVSKHLVVLERAGLISRRKQGKEVLYQVEADRLDQATRAMAEVAAQWDRRLAAIKRLAETAHAENEKEDNEATR